MYMYVGLYKKNRDIGVYVYARVSPELCITTRLYTDLHLKYYEEITLSMRLEESRLGSILSCVEVDCKALNICVLSYMKYI